MLSGSDTEAVAIKKLQLEAAEKAEVQSQKNLNKLSDDLTIKELEVESAKESVEHARQSVDLAKQSVALARQSLEQARKNLAKATITAPFDGVITAVNAEKGDTITTAMTIADMMDPSRMELIIALDEIDVPMVKVGQEVIISLDALPDSEFAGVVSAIFPMPEEVGGVVLYDIEVTLNVPEDSGIRIGMSASADIVLDKRTDVLLIPYRAINEDEEGNTFVNVVIDEEPQERPVTLGVSDGFDTEVISGLTEGEMVIETRIVR
jgi:RND family efflux transporter MFP subunit